MSLAKNGILATVVFTDANDRETAPDGSVVWTLYKGAKAVVSTATQTKDQHTAAGDGTFSWVCVPTAVGTHYVEVIATVGGAQQCARVEQEVTLV